MDDKYDLNFVIKSAVGFLMRETEVSNGNSVVKKESLRRSWSSKSITASTAVSVSVKTIHEIIELLAEIKSFIKFWS